MSDVTVPPIPGADNKKESFSSERIPNTAIFLKRVAIEFLQILFGTRAKGSFHYDLDDSKTEIQIAEFSAADLNAINVRPAIIVARGPLSWQGIGLGGNSLESIDVPTRNEVYNDLLMGSLTIVCTSRESLEAENIAHLVFNSFKFFSSTLKSKGFFTLRSLNIGQESLVEQEGSNDRTWLVPITVVANVQERWALNREATRHLNKVIAEGLSSLQ